MNFASTALFDTNTVSILAIAQLNLTTTTKVLSNVDYDRMTTVAGDAITVTTDGDLGELFKVSNYMFSCL